MTNIGRELTVDDLIVEYMVYRVNNGYEPKFSISEFMNFLKFFENKKKVNDVLYDGKELFERFFNRKSQRHWLIKNYNTGKFEFKPHIEMEYSEKDNDYIITSNYMLSDYDMSVINTYFMSRYNVIETRNIIKEYFSIMKKRKINELEEVNEDELMIGKLYAAKIVNDIWDSYVNEQIKLKKWPIQCKDMNKYLFDIDLAEIIGLKSIKKELIELYRVVSKRITILYKEDKNLRIDSFKRSYLAYANYMVISNGYEKLFNIAYGPYKTSLNIDLTDYLEFKNNDIKQYVRKLDNN